MESSENNYQYERIAKAISFIQANYQQQPSLEDIAEHVNLSSFHFQRLFQEWAGTTPKKFLQYISLSYAKKLLKESQSTSITTFDIGLSSSSRLHDLFVKLEAMTPTEFKNGGINLNINYSIQDSPFGHILIASTNKGICQITFINNPNEGETNLRREFPNANIRNNEEPIHLEAIKIFDKSSKLSSPIHIHIKGTAFQLKVWEALLKIPAGELCKYGDIAKNIGKEKASRAVGTAIGSNPIAYLIPCHRVIQSSGIFGGYRWDPIRKTAIIAWESAKKSENEI